MPNHFIASFVPSPNSVMNTSVFSPPNDQLVACIARLSIQGGKRHIDRARLSECMVVDFQKTSYIIKHDECPEIAPLPKVKNPGPVKPKCVSIGYCVCTGEGLELWAIRNNFLRALKNAFPLRQKASNKLLKERYIVIGLCGYVAPLPLGSEPDPWAVIEAENEEKASDVLPPGWKREVWLHISFMSYSPYKPTFLHMHRLADAVEES